MEKHFLLHDFAFYSQAKLRAQGYSELPDGGDEDGEDPALLTHPELRGQTSRSQEMEGVGGC